MCCIINVLITKLCPFSCYLLHHVILNSLWHWVVSENNCSWLFYWKWQRRLIKFAFVIFYEYTNNTIIMFFCEIIWNAFYYSHLTLIRLGFQLFVLCNITMYIKHITNSWEKKWSNMQMFWLKYYFLHSMYKYNYSKCWFVLYLIYIFNFMYTYCHRKYMQNMPAICM